MDTFCVLPWVGREINWEGHETHCCLLPKIYDVNQIKSDLLAGIKTPACQKCWNLENQGLKSDRQLKNQTLDFYWNKDLIKIQEDVRNGDTTVRILKLTTSYTCNASCVSCNPSASSSWAQLHVRMFPDIPVNYYKFIDFDQIRQRIDFKELKMLSLLGGEPLYEKKNFDLLEHLLDIGNDQIFLSMVTNGSVILTDHQKHILTRFKNLNFSVSIDGTESVFEYLRFPLRWTNLNKNIEFFRNISENVSSNYTLSNLNILYHPQTKAWFDQNDMIFSVSPVYHPSWLQPRALSIDIKQNLKKILDPIDFNAFIGPIHTDRDQHNFESMLENIQLQDQAKKISINDYLPELVKMF